jgi:hypothetical protein
MGTHSHSIAVRPILLDQDLGYVAHGPQFSWGGRGMHGNSEVKPQRTLKGGKLTELAPLTGKIETVPKGLAILSGSDGEVSGEV